MSRQQLCNVQCRIASVVFAGVALLLSCKQPPREYKVNGTVDIRTQCDPVDRVLISIEIYDRASGAAQIEAFPYARARGTFERAVPWLGQRDAPTHWRIIDVSNMDGTRICPHDSCAPAGELIVVRNGRCVETERGGIMQEAAIVNGVPQPLEVIIRCECWMRPRQRDE
jgi:hypothetical protein